MKDEGGDYQFPLIFITIVLDNNTIEFTSVQ